MSNNDKLLRDLYPDNIREVYSRLTPSESDRKDMLYLAVGMFITGAVLLYAALSDPQVYNKVIEVTQQFYRIFQ